MNDRKFESPAEALLTPVRRERLKNVLDNRTNSLTVVLDNVKNAHNISAVLRSCDAFGVMQIHMVGEDFKYSKGIALGTERWVSQSKYTAADDVISKLKAEGYKFVVLQPAEKSPAGKSCSVIDLPFEEKLALIFGNEKHGVSKEFEPHVDFYAHIPMIGFVESFNISVAAAICLFCSGFSGAKHTRRTTHLSADERSALHKRWLEKSIKRSDIVVRELEKHQR